MTPSPYGRRSSMPNPWARWRASASSSTNDPGSSSASIRSRAVIRPSACLLSTARAEPAWTASSALCWSCASFPAVVRRSGSASSPSTCGSAVMRRSVRRVHDREPSSPWSDLERPPLSAARLRRGLVDDGSWRALDVVGRTASTNADVSARARAGEAAGYVLIAEEQTAGRGRLDRSWQAPARSSLLMSVLLRPESAPSTWTLLPFVAGVAVAEAARGVGQLSAELKWPNDVLVDGRKLGGILVERVESAVIVGIGVNVSLRSTELPVPTATSVALAGGVADREVLAKEVLRALARRHDAWQAADGASSAILPAYREICATIGWTVTVQLPGGDNVDGLVSGVDDTGRLVVMSSDGAMSVSAGGVVHVRRGGWWGFPGGASLGAGATWWGCI